MRDIKDVVILITNANSKHYRIRNSSINAKDWFNKNNINFIEFDINELSYDDIKYIVETAELLTQNGELTMITDLINLHSRLNHKKNKKILEQYNIYYYDIQPNQVVDAVFYCRDLLRTPIAIKNDIAVIGCNTSDFQQFLEGEQRNDILWLGGNKDFTDEQKINWILKNFKPPKTINLNNDNSRLYFPSTSVLYGGNIKWEYDKEFFDNDGNIYKTGKTKIKISVELGGIQKETTYDVNIVN